MEVLKKKWLKILFMMSFALTLVLPAKAVKAADYDVWVNGEQFTDAKTSITCGSGTAVYDNATKTLTLTNATIGNATGQAIGTAYSADSANELIYVTGQDLTIVLNGTNVLDASAVSSNRFGIVAAGKCALKITGTGSLEMKGVESGIWVGDWAEDDRGSLTIEKASGIKISASGNDYNDGITVYGSLSILDSTIEINVEGNKKTGIEVDTDKVVQIKNSTVTINSTGTGISVGDSVAKDGGINFDHSTVKLKYTTKEGMTEPDAQYGIELTNYWAPGDDSNDGVISDRIITVTNGGTLQIEAKTGVVKNANSAKITLPKDSTFSGNAAEGWGNQIVGSNKVKITIGTGTALVDGSGKDAGSSGGGEGGGGNGTGGNGTGGNGTGGNGTGGNGTGGNGTGGNGSGGNGTGGNGSGNGSGDRATQKGEDGTFLSKGASMEAAESFLLDYSSESDPAGTSFGILCARSTKTTNNSVKVNWKKVSGASKYLVFAAKCGKGNKVKQIAETTSTSYNLKKLDGAKIKKGTYYKFVIVAIDGSNDVIATSKMVHSATLGGKVGNCKTITTKAKKNKVSLKAKKTFKLKAKQTAQKKSLKIKKHRADQYESSDEKVATVNKKGVIKGVAPGKCSVFVYAQNGVYKEIKVTVK